MDKRIILFAVGALMMAACSSNETKTPDPSGEIRLYTEVAPLQTRAAEVLTDLQDTQFAAGTDISVLVNDNTTGDIIVTYPKQTYTADGLGGLTTAVPQYYPASGSSVNICAFHPWDATENFPVATDQTSTASYRASDLMWAKLTNITKDTPEADRVLTFNHLFSKIIVRLIKGNGVTQDEIDAAKITLGNSDLVCSVRFDAGDGTYTLETPGTETMTIATDAGTSVHAAIVVPQVMTGKVHTVALGGGEQSYVFPEITFKKGMKYTYTITVNKAELVVTTTIEDWTTADGLTDITETIKI